MGMRVIIVKVLDKDIGDMVWYLLEGSDLFGYFCINWIIGVILIVGYFDRENMIEYEIFVQVMDSVNLIFEKVKIIIRIDDVNDNVLFFLKLFYV